ncbi:MAG: choice-of-anchor L domain-containing protein [Myxococcales bacterium]|nr:choice-of-anchor L domain-containing protein [Myxococcales bacterium]
MNRLGWAASCLALGLAGGLACSSDETTGLGTGGNGTGASGGSGGQTTSSSTTSSQTGGSGGTTTSTQPGGSGGAGGAGAAGGSTTSSGGSGGAGNVGTGGSGGDPGETDADADGWTPNQGDCCDTPNLCSAPALVNPGAYEYPGNLVDDDCDPATSDLVAPADCSPAPLSPPTTSDALIQAMDLCQVTTENPPLAQRKWGVISTALTLADEATALPPADNVQTGVLASYGSNVTPRRGSTMASLSSGTARDPGDVGYVHPQNGAQAGQTGNFNGNTQVSAPASFLAPHGGKFPSPANCPACNGAACTQAYDSASLRARIRVPTNAKSFSYAVKFYSAEFPEYLCQAYNDFFVTLFTSSWLPDPNANPPELPLPADGNIAIDALGGQLSVNNGFFQVCFPPLGSPPGTCPSGTLELVGTGMGGWGNNLTDGGGTEWLTNTAPVVPGETMEIEFMIWDAGDHNVDSLVLLDRFRWSVDASPVGLSK